MILNTRLRYVPLPFLGDEDSEVVFSESSGEGHNILGDLESQVMRAAPIRLRQ